MSRESIRNTISLMLITVIAGLLLGAVYEVTKEPIREQKQRAKEAAYKEVFADAADFEEQAVDDKREADLKEQGMDVQIDEVMKVLDAQGNGIGYVLTVTDHEGYGGDIQFAMGVRTDGTLNSISFLSIGETAGLGMKAQEDAFKGQFAGKKVEHFSYTKDGATSESEIDAISGATITTNAVTNGVNAGLSYIDALSE
ncbi:MAG: RnfABCDGE type electron transport complex subunit G [Lachnospiraceae bacterium]|nr:RnfABCDGE type electron transport complex subunit G [Lachnospiraceae bacterium]